MSLGLNCPFPGYDTATSCSPQPGPCRCSALVEFERVVANSTAFRRDGQLPEGLPMWEAELGAPGATWCRSWVSRSLSLPAFDTIHRLSEHLKEAKTLGVAGM